MDKQRTGSSHRINPDRFFHVMNQGWYLFTREGVQGPYEQRHDAESYLSSFIDDSTTVTANQASDSNDSWRM